MYLILGMAKSLWINVATKLKDYFAVWTQDWRACIDPIQPHKG